MKQSSKVTQPGEQALVCSGRYLDGEARTVALRHSANPATICQIGMGYLPKLDQQNGKRMRGSVLTTTAFATIVTDPSTSNNAASWI